MKTCVRCGGELTSRVEDYPYTGCGFTVILNGITVHRCASCGASAPSLPNVIGLHRAIVRMVAAKAAPLDHAETAFLTDFLRNEGVKVGAFLAMARRLPRVRFVRYAEYILRGMALAHVDRGETRRVADPDPDLQLWPREAAGDRPARWSLRPRAPTELHPS
jgi:hypothetical protein